MITKVRCHRCGVESQMDKVATKCLRQVRVQECWSCHWQADVFTIVMYSQCPVCRGNMDSTNQICGGTIMLFKAEDKKED